MKQLCKSRKLETILIDFLNLYIKYIRWVDVDL